MEKYYRLKTISNYIFVAIIVFEVIAIAGLTGNIAYRIADQMWTSGHHYSVIAMTCGSFAYLILLSIQLVLLSIRQRILRNEIKRIKEEIERNNLAIKVAEKAGHND